MATPEDDVQLADETRIASATSAFKSEHSFAVGQDCTPLKQEAFIPTPPQPPPGPSVRRRRRRKRKQRRRAAVEAAVAAASHPR